MLKKAFKSIVVAVLTFSLMLQLCSCIRFRTKYKFMHDSSEIVTIELVECSSYEEDERCINTLMNIENVHAFMQEFSKITYKTPGMFAVVQGIAKSELVVKITYMNGDFELINNGQRSMYVASEGAYHWNNVVGRFNDEQYDALISKYLNQYQSPIFYTMHSDIDIEKIEIVDAYAVEDRTPHKEVQDLIVEVKDIQSFLKQLRTISYKYKIKNGVCHGSNRKEEHRKAIKIYYKNGDYEVIDNNWRDFYSKTFNQYCNNAYIGEFDLTEYTALIERTIAENQQ